MRAFYGQTFSRCKRSAVLDQWCVRSQLQGPRAERGADVALGFLQMVVAYRGSGRLGVAIIAVPQPYYDRLAILTRLRPAALDA